MEWCFWLCPGLCPPSMMSSSRPPPPPPAESVPPVPPWTCPTLHATAIESHGVMDAVVVLTLEDQAQLRFPRIQLPGLLCDLATGGAVARANAQYLQESMLSEGR